MYRVYGSKRTSDATFLDDPETVLKIIQEAKNDFDFMDKLEKEFQTIVDFLSSKDASVSLLGTRLFRTTIADLSKTIE